MTPTSTILIVDDQPGSQEVLKGLLANQNYSLAIASSGEEALTKAIELRPDLIILDVMMPGMDGFTVCQALRANPLLAQIPVIMITALDDRDSRLRGFQVGADEFISKPFDQPELQVRVKTITQLNRYRRLHAERARFEWVVDHADDGYLIVTAADRLLYANSQACRYLGLPRGHGPFAQTFLELARQQYHCEPQVIWNNWSAQATNPLSAYLIRPASARENSFWLQVDRVELLNDPGTCLIRLRDISSSMSATRHMWTFHDQVCHKLRTPISLVTGFLELSINNSSSAEQKELLANAHENALRLQAEIQDILQYVSITGNNQMFPSYCAVAEIPEIISQVEASLNLSPVKITQSGIDDPWQVYLPLSARGIELILQELLENAQKFHPQNLPEVEIKISGQGPDIRLQVCDNGLSLSPNQLNTIWLPYYQAEKYFTGQIAGMGLGLAMVASLVWEAGGTCQSYNRATGPGLVIDLLLPWKRYQVHDNQEYGFNC